MPHRGNPLSRKGGNIVKRRQILLILLLVIVAATGCAQPIALHQPESEILQIDLVYSPFGEQEVLYTLAEEEMGPFLDALFELNVYKSWSPQNIGGTFTVCITYKDGSAEILGNASIGYLSNGTLEHDGWYSLSSDDLRSLFTEYADLSLYPSA